MPTISVDLPDELAEQVRKRSASRPAGTSAAANTIA
jgi:hypothetical protein